MRLLFISSTGLGDVAAEAGSVCEVADLVQARYLIQLGRAVPAPEGEEPSRSPAIVNHTKAAKKEKSNGRT